MIADSEITNADPAAVIEQFMPWVIKLAKRYSPALEKTGAIDSDDLYQIGCIALLKAQKTYDPARGANFLTHSSFHIRGAIRAALGFSSDGRPPRILKYLDEPLTEDSDETRLDMIEDPSILPFDEPLIEAETKKETAEAVHAAIDRLKNEKQKEIINRCWINGQDKPAAAAEMGINIRALQAVDLEARHKLRRDKLLKQYVMSMPSFHFSRSRFNSTWTSEVEAAVIWREEHYPAYLARLNREAASF